MFAHGELNKRFLALDQHPVLLETNFQDWLAWPMVKESLWLLCIEQSDQSPRSSRGIFKSGIRLASGMLQIILNLVNCEKRNGAFLYTPRDIKLPNQKILHPFLGDLSCIEKDAPWFHWQYSPGTKTSISFKKGIVENYGISAVITSVATFVQFAPSIQNTAEKIVDALETELPEIDRGTLLTATVSQLARFRVLFVFARWLFIRWEIPQVVVLDADGKTPEIAAAKSLNLPVIEVQHGMISTHEPDYSWTTVHRNLDHALPLPDKIIVFGPLWANQIRTAGYWQDYEVIEANSSLLSAYKTLRSEQPSRQDGAPLQILFSSQGYVRDVALVLWHTILTQQTQDGENVFHLCIKVHPLEQQYISQYQELAQKFPDHVLIIESGKEAFDQMLKADVVVGYTSLMLIEAIGLGIPTIALKGGRAIEGISEIFKMQDIDDFIISCEDVNDLFSLLKDLLKSDQLRIQKEKIVRNHDKIYSFNAPYIEEIISQ